MYYNSHGTDSGTGLRQGHVVGRVVGQHGTDDGRVYVEAVIGIGRVLGPLQEGALKLHAETRDRLGWKAQH